MARGTAEPRKKIADLNLAGACPVCDGPVDVRASPTLAYGYCATCHWISKPRLGMTPKGLSVEYPAAAA